MQSYKLKFNKLPSVINLLDGKLYSGFNMAFQIYPDKKPTIYHLIKPTYTTIAISSDNKGDVIKKYAPALVANNTLLASYADKLFDSFREAEKYAFTYKTELLEGYTSLIHQAFKKEQKEKDLQDSVNSK